MNPQYMTQAQFFQELEVIQAQVQNPLEGIFGPESMTWEVNKYMTNYLGAGRAVLLQLAHPWVATAIDQHSVLKTDFVGRLRRTFIPVLTMVYGSMEQALHSAKNVYQVHCSIAGKIPRETGIFAQGSPYCANEINALIWVYSTLLETSVQMYELFLRKLSNEEKDKYYEESRLFAGLFGIPHTALPADWAAFMEYNKGMWESNILTVSEEARHISTYLINWKIHPLLKKFWKEYGILTSLLMPPRLREAFELPADTPENQQIFEKNIQRIKTFFPYLPRHLKYLPPYLEACCRIHPKKTDPFILLLNHLIFKKARLVS